MPNFLQSLAGILAPGLGDVSAEATAAEQQLTIAFQTLIAEGAVAVILLAAILFVLTKK